MPDEESSKSLEPSAPGKRPRARRSRRGGRGRGRKPTAVAPEITTKSPLTPGAAQPETTNEGMHSSEPPAEAMPMADSPIEELRHQAAEEFARDPYEEEEQVAERPDRSFPERAERRDFKPAPPAAIADAIAEVNQIIASLKLVLDQMEEVLETLELAEVQKNLDEREIQSLRNALRHVERRGGEPRDEPHVPHASRAPRHEPRRGRR